MTRVAESQVSIVVYISLNIHFRELANIISGIMTNCYKNEQIKHIKQEVPWQVLVSFAGRLCGCT